MTATNVGIRITAQDSTGAAFATVKQNLKGMESAADQLKNSFGGIAGALGSAFAVGGMLITGGAKLVQVQREFDVLNSSLTTVAGSSAKAEQEFEWIKRFAATTPYQLNEVTGAFVKMKALGLDASATSLASYGNTASAMGKGLNQMIEAVADAATGEFERLKEFGIKAKKSGDEVSLTFQGVTTSIGNNAAEITRYLQQIGNVEFSGAMEERAKTLDGVLSNLADNWDEVFRTVNKGGFGAAAINDAKTLNTALQGLNDTLLSSQSAGDGMMKQLADGAGFALGTAAIGTLNSAASGLNWTLNALTGGFLNLNENVRLLPESLMTNEQRAAALAEKLKAAEAEFDRLNVGTNLVPGNFLDIETQKAKLLVEELRRAKAAQDLLTKAPLTSQSEGRIKATNAYYDNQAKDQQKVTDLLAKSSGVSDAYIKRMKEIGEANATGAMSADQLATALDAAYGMLSKGTSGTRGTKSAVNEFANLNAEIAKSGELAAEQLASSNGLAESDRYRIEMLNKLIGAYTSGKITLSQYIDLESEMTDVENTKRQIEELKAALKISEDRAALRKKEYEDAAAYGLAQTDLYNAQVKGAEEALAAAQAEYAQYGLSKAQIAEITLLTLQSTQAKYQDGSEGYAAVQKQIDAQRALIGVLKNTEGLEAAKKVADAWQQTANSISNDLTDAFMGAITNGENLFQNLAKSVEKMFAEMVLRPVVQGVVNDTMSAIGLGSTASTTSGIMGMANTASSLNSIWGAGSQLLTGASAGASTASLIGANAVGAIGGDALGTLATLNGGWAGVAAGATEAGAAAGASAATGALAAIPVWGWAALAVAAIAGFAGNDRLPSQGTGEGQLSFDASGTVTDSYSRFGEGDSNLGLTTAVNDTITALYTDYAKTAAALGIQMVDTQFSFGANTGLEGKDPQFAIGSNAGGVGYSSGEIQQTDEAVQLAASRAVFNALQQSELPTYLAGAFDGLTASTATQEQITATLDGAAALQSFHTQLQALPWDSLKDMTYATTQALVDLSGGLDQLQSNLGTYYDKFYTDSEKTSDLTAATADAFAALGITMPTATDGLRDWYRGLVDSVLALDQSDAANAGATVAVLALQTAVDTLAPTFNEAAQAIAEYQSWQDKLDVLNGVTTERAQQQAADLAAASDEATRALINQVYAAEDLATLRQSAMDAVSTAIDAAIGQAEAGKDAAMTAYDALAESIQTSLDPVADSIGKLQSLSTTLKGTLDSMALAGSDGIARSAAQGQISAALDTARSTGALPLDGQLDNALRTVAQPSEKLFATFEDYARDFYKTANDITALADLTGTQLSADQAMQSTLDQQLDQAKESFDAQTEYFDSQIKAYEDQATAAQELFDATTAGTLSVVDAITALQEAMKPGSTNKAANTTQQSGSSGGYSYVTDNPTTTTNGLFGGFFDGYLDNIDSATAIIQGLDWSNPADAINQLWEAQQAAGQSLTNNILANASGFTQAEIEAMFASQGLQSFAVGTNYVPNDMIAQIHKGDAIIPAPYNPANGSSTQDNSAMLAKFDSMIARLERIEASNADIAGYTKRTDSTLIRVTRGGEQMQVSAA